MAKRLPPSRRVSAASAAPTAAKQLQLQRLAAGFRAVMAEGRFADGLGLAKQALDVVPGNPRVLSDYALCLMRTGDYHAAYRTYLLIAEASPEQQRLAAPTWIDGLAEVCGSVSPKNFVAMDIDR
jgi:Flp pilus assembly protein TadD